MSIGIRAMLSTKKGFTLMELLIVIAIIAILTVAFLPNALNAPKKARDVVRMKKISDIQTAVEAYAAENSVPPASDGSNCFIGGDLKPAKVLGMTVPKDTNNLKSCHASDAVAALADDAAGANKFFYSVKPGGAYYVIGAVVEATSNANSKANAFADITAAMAAAADEAAFKANPAILFGTKGAGKFYLATGPL